MTTPWFRRPWLRRGLFAGAALIAGLFCFWPQHYLAEAELLPQDSAGGLSAALSQGTGSALINLGSLIGNKQPVEADLTIARSEAVLDAVIGRLHLIGKPGYPDLKTAARRLGPKLTVESIRGSILQITAKDGDPKFALAITQAGADAIQERLTELNLAQTLQRKVVAENRMAEVTKTLTDAQAALQSFRNVNHLAAPNQQLGVAVGLLASLQGELQAKEIEIATLQHFTTPDNIRLQAARAELNSLRVQVSDAKTQAEKNISSPEWVASQDATYFNLYRDERQAEILYEIYQKYLEQVTIDALASNQNMFLMQPAYIHPERQYNIPAIGILALIILTALTVEFYIATPPIGRGSYGL